MPTAALRLVAQNGATGAHLPPVPSAKLPGKGRLGAAQAQKRVPRASLSEAVLVNVQNHTDGTVTYKFGDSATETPATVPVVLHEAHHEPAVPAVTLTNGAAAAAAAAANGAAAAATATVAPPAPATTVKQLDKLLHMTPQVGSNGSHASNTANGSGKKPRHTLHQHDSRLLDSAVEVQRSLEKAAAKRTASHPSSSSSVTLDSVNYTEASAAQLDGLYSRLCDSGRLDDALSVLKEAIRAKRTDVLCMLRHYKFLRAAQRARSVRSALRFIQLFPRQFVDARTYNMVLSVCAEAGDVRAAMRVADMLRAAGLRMDTVLYTNLIKACAAAGDADRAFQLYSEMKSAGVRTEKQVYATLVSACSAAILATPPSDRRTQLVLLERAFSIVEGMQAARVPGDAAVWNALVAAAGRAGQLQRAFDVLDEMLGAGVRPNARTYASLIDACARTGDKDLALRVYAKATREGFDGELLVYSSAINACVRSRDGADLSSAMDVYADMQRAGVAPDSALFGSLMMAAGAAGDLPLALELQAEMEREGLRPCSGTESALLTVHLRNGKLAEAQGIYRRLRKAGVIPHVHAANALVNALGKESRLGDAVALVCDMADAGLAPDSFTFAAVLGACQRADECELGLDVYRAARLRGVKIDNAIAETMLKMCYGRMRQRWRPGGYPPRRLREEDGAVAPGAGTAGMRHSGEGHRAQERARLLGALLPAGRKAPPAADPGEVPWQGHAFHIYRDAVAAGVKPSMRLLNLALSCLRVPWQEAVGGDGDPALDLAAQTQRLLVGLPPSAEGATPAQGKIGVESVYHVRAISMIEEAIVAGLLPSFKVDSSAPVDLRALPPAVAEVYVLAVVAAAQRQVEARREVNNRMVFLVPRYDGHRVFMPSFLDEEGKKARAEAAAAERRAAEAAAASRDSSSDSEEDDAFAGAALREDQPCTGDERTGLGVAGVLRRLRLWAREYSPEGLIVVEARQVTRWAKMIQRDVEKRSASALALQKPYGQPTGGDLRRQASSIRSSGF